MAILYRVREGSGEGAIASSQMIELASVATRFQNVRTKYSPRMPVVGEGSANPVSEPIAVVIQVLTSDQQVSPFTKEGYFLLENVRPRDSLNLVGSAG